MERANWVSRIDNRLESVPEYITGFRLLCGFRLLFKRFVTLPAIVRTRSGVIAFLGFDRVDDIILRHLNDTHERMYFVSTLVLKEGDVVLDVGTHHGLYALELSYRFPGVKIYSFEPDRTSLRYLRFNLLLNSRRKIVVIPKALSDRNGVGYIVQSEEGSWGNYVTGSKGRKTSRISLISVDEFLDEFKVKSIALLKLNAEGSEFGILPQMFKANVYPLRIILFAHPEKGNVENLLREIQAKGYSIEYSNDDKVRPCFVLCLVH